MKKGVSWNYGLGGRALLAARFLSLFDLWCDLCKKDFFFKLVLENINKSPVALAEQATTGDKRH